MGQTVIRLPAPEHPSAKTFCRKFIVAVDSGLICGDTIAFIEDDDWYGSTHLETLATMLVGHDIAGECPALYYHVGIRAAWQHDNQTHASLCQTAISRAVLPTLKSIAETRTPAIDLELWRMVRGGRPYAPVGGKRSCVGIKGLPGRAGLGSGHQPDARFKPDQRLAFLRQIIGDDADVYARFAITPTAA